MSYHQGPRIQSRAHRLAFEFVFYLLSLLMQGSQLAYLLASLARRKVPSDSVGRRDSSNDHRALWCQVQPRCSRSSRRFDWTPSRSRVGFAARRAILMSELILRNKAKQLCRDEGKAWSFDDFENRVPGVTMLTIVADERKRREYLDRARVMLKQNSR
jgi:hypothetical protein